MALDVLEWLLFHFFFFFFLFFNFCPLCLFRLSCFVYSFELIKWQYKVSIFFICPGTPYIYCSWNRHACFIVAYLSFTCFVRHILTNSRRVLILKFPVPQKKPSSPFYPITLSFMILHFLELFNCGCGFAGSRLQAQVIFGGSFEVKLQDGSQTNWIWWNTYRCNYSWCQITKLEMKYCCHKNQVFSIKKNVYKAKPSICLILWK